MLRDGVLTGRTIALAGAGPGLAEQLTTLGAAIRPDAAPAPGRAHPAPAAPARSGGRPVTAAAADGRPDTLVVDTRSAFTAAGGGYAGVRAAIDGAFTVTRETALAHWIDAAGPGQVVLVAPAPGAGRHAGAARAGLENLARTLATEWARHAVTTVAVLPGDATAGLALAELVAWLATPAGAYLSGTALTLDALPARLSAHLTEEGAGNPAAARGSTLRRSSP